MTAKNSSNTAKKQESRRGKNEKTVAAQFQKGYDPRRNLKGRPKSFDQLRALAQDIAEQIATDKAGTPIMWNGQEITFAEFILLAWATDKKQMDKFIEYAYGKVPQNLDLTTGGEKLNWRDFINAGNTNTDPKPDSK